MDRAPVARLVAAAGLAACLLVGCGSSKPTGREVKGVPISGSLLQHGKPLKLKNAEVITISFVLPGATPEDQIVGQGEYNPNDGSFVVKGPTGQGIPPGKYKIGLSNDYSDGSGGGSRFSDEFDSETGNLTADVGTEEGQVFIIDVGTRRVTKKK